MRYEKARPVSGDISNEKAKTINEWSKEFDVEIMDPDGFNRTDKYLYERYFTKDEFQKGMLQSTLIANTKKWND